MLHRFPKNDKYFGWTNHIKNKMLFYNLSEQRIKRVFQTPKRREEGIAPGTTAAMQSSPTKKKPEEIWIMYKTTKQNKGQKFTRSSKILMISAWRYPGISKPGAAIPIPQDILEELDQII